LLRLISANDKVAAMNGCLSDGQDSHARYQGYPSSPR
jgi:hypothetical protein